MSGTALIVGATGLSGSYLATELASRGWVVVGLSRSGGTVPGLSRAIAVELTDRAAVQAALMCEIGVTHVFFCTWTRQATEAANCVANRAMVRNVLQALSLAPLQRVSLVTGAKHYMGPFEAYAKGRPYTPFMEDQPRLPGLNFYYEQEDEIFETAAERGFTWTVHRPHTMIGFALGNAMNMAVTLAVYASICRETGRPFMFPGSRNQYAAIADITDARILARQIAWSAVTPEAANTAFNIVNGDLFRWHRMWGRIADYFDLEPAELPPEPMPLERQMVDAEPIWNAMVQKYALQSNPVNRLASWWHTDGDLGREIECFNDMKNSRSRGFDLWQDSERSFFDVFDRLIAERVIPDFRA